ncbi:hypothetical protein OROGR_011744 [Orobanche gracilis]
MGSITLAVLLITKHLEIFAWTVGEIQILEGLPEFFVPKNIEYAKSLIPTTILITGVAILLRHVEKRT